MNGEDNVEHKAGDLGPGYLGCCHLRALRRVCLVTPQNLGMQQFLQMMLPAFKWLTWWGFLLGLIESFLYGAYAGLVFCPIYNFLHRHFGPHANPSG